MDEFLENIINYLQEKFSEDTDLSVSKRPQVYDSYQVNHEPQASKPEIQVQIIDLREQVNYTTFCGKQAINIPLQITAYTGQVKIKGEMTNAQHSSIKLADKIVRYIDDLIYQDNNYGITFARHISSTPALPMNDGGSIYASAVRYDFIVQNI